MPMDAGRLGTAIANTIKSFKPADGVAITDAILIQMWTAVAQDFIDEVNNNADIELLASDISILPGTFKDSLNAPITGVGVNNATTLSGKIK